MSNCEACEYLDYFKVASDNIQMMSREVVGRDLAPSAHLKNSVRFWLPPRTAVAVFAVFRLPSSPRVPSPRPTKAPAYLEPHPVFTCLPRLY